MYKRSDKSKQGYLILEIIKKKEYYETVYKIKNQELNLKQFKTLSDEELLEVNGGGGWGSAFAGWLGGIGVNPGQTAQQVVNQLNGVTGFHAYNHNPYGSGGTPND